MSQSRVPRLFHGFEVEGKYRGYPTLFVQDRVPKDIILQAINSIHATLAHIYFGASWKIYTSVPSDIDFGVVDDICRFFTRTLVTIEVDSLANVYLDLFKYPNLHIIHVVKSLSTIVKEKSVLSHRDPKFCKNLEFKYVDKDVVMLIDSKFIKITRKEEYKLLNDTLIGEE